MKDFLHDLVWHVVAVALFIALLWVLPGGTGPV